MSTNRPDTSSNGQLARTKNQSKIQDGGSERVES